VILYARLASSPGEEISVQADDYYDGLEKLREQIPEGDQMIGIRVERDDR
jgi:hypothetical protein